LSLIEVELQFRATVWDLPSLAIALWQYQVAFGNSRMLFALPGF
jgi:hypothetical protein